MATIPPIDLTTEWVKVVDGAWSGGIQNIGGNRIYGFVQAAAAPMPSTLTLTRGFLVTEEMKPIGIAAGESLYCRSVLGPSTVVLA